MKKLISLFLLLASFYSFSQTTTNSVLSTGNWYKIAVNETGIYKLTYTDLVNIGIDVNSINPKNIRIYGNGAGMLSMLNSDFRYDDLVENAIKVIGENDSVFNLNDYVLFYGESPVKWEYNSIDDLFGHQVNYYSGYTYYFLTTDLGAGKRIQLQNSEISPPNQYITTFDDYLFHESENVNLLKSGRLWLGEIFDDTLSYNFNFSFPNLETSTPVILTASVYARSAEISSFDIEVNIQPPQNISVSNVNLSGYTYAAGSSTTFSFTSSSDNISVNILYNKSTSSSVGWLNYITLNAMRNLIMFGSQVNFRDIQSVGAGNISEFTISNVPDSINIWEVTEPLNVKEQMPSGPVSVDELSFVLNTDSLREFIAFDTIAFLSPVFIETVANQNLHGLSQAEMLIVCHSSLLNEANNLANHHINHDGFNVHVVTVDEIYNEFSSGAQDISAIRDFVKMFYDRAATVSEKPKYLLLFGDASYDYKDRIDNNTNLVPSYQSLNSLSPINSFVTDDFFGLLDDGEGEVSGLLDIGIGRIPAKTTTEAQAVVDKIIHYSTNAATLRNWRNELCFIGDDEDGNQHMAQADDLAEKIDTMYPCYNINKIYLDNYVQILDSAGYHYPDVENAINNQVEKGALIINYTGCGSEFQWAHENVLDISDIQNWNNIDNPPLFYTATAEFGRFDNPGTVSGGEHIILNPNGGGIGSIVPTRLTYSSSNFALNKAFYDFAFSRNINDEYYRLGELIRLTKINSGSGKRYFALLGDPALMLAYPEYNIITTLINGTDISFFTDTIFPGNLVTVNGYIEDSTGNIYSNFNGTLYYKVYDIEIEDTTLGNDSYSPFIFNTQDYVLYEDTTIIINGEFEIEFTMPSGISTNFGFGKLSYYATDYITDAKGCYCDLPVGSGTSGVNNITNTGKFRIFPTITSGTLNIELSSVNSLWADITIHNITGKKVYTKRINNIYAHKLVTLDLSSLPNGLYLIKIDTNEEFYSAKFVKQ